MWKWPQCTTDLVLMLRSLSSSIRSAPSWMEIFLDNFRKFCRNKVEETFKMCIGIKFLVGHKVTGGQNNGTSGSLTVESVKGGAA